MDPTQIVDYLANGGLVEILRRGSGGKSPTKAWLVQDGDGAVTATFLDSPDGVGGQAIPVFTLQDGKIFLPDVDKVVDYLLTFGLDKWAAQEVVRRVGTSA
jgi:hypothetical protein